MVGGAGTQDSTAAIGGEAFWRDALEERVFVSSSVFFVLFLERVGCDIRIGGGDLSRRRGVVVWLRKGKKWSGKGAEEGGLWDGRAQLSSGSGRRDSAWAGSFSVATPRGGGGFIYYLSDQARLN